MSDTFTSVLIFVSGVLAGEAGAAWRKVLRRRRNRDAASAEKTMLAHWDAEKFKRRPAAGKPKEGD